MHDPLCPKSVYYDGVDVPCRCDLIAKARADERERVQSLLPASDPSCNCPRCTHEVAG